MSSLVKIVRMKTIVCSLRLVVIADVIVIVNFGFLDRSDVLEIAAFFLS